MKRLWLIAVLALLFCMSQSAMAIRPVAIGDVVHKGGGVYDPRGYGAKGDNSTNDYAAINRAATAANGNTLEFKAGTYIIGTNLTLDEDAFFYKGAVIKPSNGIVITLTGALTAGPYQIFDESLGGTVTVSNGMSNEVLPQWWNGAVIQAFTDADATPSVKKGRMFATANTSPATITMFDDGISGQVIRVFIGDANTTFDFTSTNLKGNGGADWTAADGDALIAGFDGTDWYCLLSNPAGTVTTAEKDLVSGGGLTGGEDNVLVGVDSDLTLAVGAGDLVIVNADEIEVYGLVASDGTPNDAAVTDADGDVTFNYNITVDGITTLTTVTQAITAVGDAIVATATRMELNPDADYILTSTPHILDGTKGDLLLITAANAEGNTVTLQDQDTLGGSNVHLGAETRAITGQTVLLLAFDGSDWIEEGYGAAGIGDVLGDIVAGSRLTGGADDVLPGADADVTISLTPIANIVTVGATGCEYTTVQGAIDSIGDNTSINQYTVLIYPGTYTEDIVMEDYVSLMGVGDFGTVVIAGTNSAPLITFDADTSISGIYDLTLYLAPTIDAQSMVAISNGTHYLTEVSLLVASATNDIEANMVTQTGGTMYYTTCWFNYDMDGSTDASVKTHSLIEISGTSIYHFLGTNGFDVDIADEDDTLVVINEIVGGTISEAHIKGSRFDINMSHTDYDGLSGILYLHGTGTEKSIADNHFHFSSSGANGDTGYWLYMDTTAGGGEVHSTANFIHVEGFTNNYRANIAAGDVLDSHFDDVRAVSGDTGAGTFDGAYSPADGDLDVSGGLTVDGITTFTTSVAQAITAVGDTILADATRIELNPDANYTLTSTPHIADGTKGDILIITCANAEGNTVTLQDQDTLGGSNVELGAATRGITGKTVLVLAFDGSDWIEVNYGAAGLGDILKDLVAGDGLTGGADDVLPGADGDVTVTVGAGDGIRVGADEVEAFGLVASDGTPNDAVFCDADGNVAVKYETVFTPSTTQVIDAVGDVILANATSVELNPDADYTMTSTPTMADGTEGQIVYISAANGEGNTVTIQDEDTLAGSNFQLAGDDVEVTGQKVLGFRFDGTDWIELTGKAITNINKLTIVNELTIPTDDNPTTDDDGELALDTNDDALEVYSGGKSSLIPTVDDKDWVILEPDGIARELPIFHVDADRYPHGITIINTQIQLEADAAYSMVYEEWSGADPPVYQADVVTVTTGAADTYAEVVGGAIGNAVLDADDWLFLHIPATDVDSVACKILFYINEGN